MQHSYVQPQNLFPSRQHLPTMRHLTLLTFMSVCVALTLAMPAPRPPTPPQRDGKFLVFVFPESLGGPKHHEEEEEEGHEEEGGHEEAESSYGHKYQYGHAGYTGEHATGESSTTCSWPFCYTHIN